MLIYPEKLRDCKKFKAFREFKLQLQRINFDMKKCFMYLAALLIASGCSSHPSFDMQISPSKELAKVYGYYPTFEVDVAAISNEDAIRLSSYPVEKYFEPSDPVRQYFEPVTFRFSEDDLKVKKIESGSDVYDRLMSRSPDYIAMLVNLPFTDKESKKLDPRVFIYKLGNGMFDRNPDLYVKVGATGLIRTDRIGAKNDLPGAPETDKQPVKMKLNCESVKGEKNMQCREVKPQKKPGQPH